MAVAARDAMVTGAHDLSGGGLAQALVEACLIGESGARVVLPEGADPFVWLLSESAARMLVAVPRTQEVRFTDLCSARGLPWTKIGVSDVESETLQIQDVAKFSLTELRSAWESTLPELFG